MINVVLGRVNKLVFILGDRKSGRNCKNHTFAISENFRNLRLEPYFNIKRTSPEINLY